MTDERSRRGLNPNARAFVPNPAARAFIPGQPYVFTAPQQQQQQQPMYGNPPPTTALPYPIYQQYAHMGPPPPSQPPQSSAPAVAMSTGAQMYRQLKQQSPWSQAPPQQQQQQQPDPIVEKPPAEAWDDDDDDDDDIVRENEQEPRQVPNVDEAKDKIIDEKGERPTLKDDDSAADDQCKRCPIVEFDEPINVDDEITDNTAVAAAAAGAAAVAATATTKVENGEAAAIAAALSEDKRKEHVNMVFIGHVDAGKSTIGGQLMYLMGMVDKRTLEKYEREAKDKGRESWFLSWALDTNDEEREKGKTVECGRAFFETEGKHFTILDAPGHKSYVPNMINGAAQADLAILVISARKGEFETGFDRGGQTREHAMLVRTAGIRHLVVLVNKMDDPTVNWDEMRFKEIQDKLSPYLRKCGYSPKSDVIFIPVSGLTGAFLKERPNAEFGSWYTGPCFVEYLEAMLPPISRDYVGPVRIIVADKYNDMGTIAIGKMESGVVCKGQMLTVMPNRTNVQVIQLWSDEVETDKVVSGDNVKLKLKGVDDTDILPGFVLCSTDAPCHVGRLFDAEVVILDHKSIIAPGYSCVLHIQSATEEVVVKTVICTIDKKTGKKERKRFVKQDEKCIIRLESTESFCMEAFKDFPQMGRFTLRDEGRTIAIGKVLKVLE